jgi:sRNA-binding carbon storage regulator CsrA
MGETTTEVQRTEGLRMELKEKNHRLLLERAELIAGYFGFKEEEKIQEIYKYLNLDGSNEDFRLVGLLEKYKNLEPEAVPYFPATDNVDLEEAVSNLVAVPGELELARFKHEHEDSLPTQDDWFKEKLGEVRAQVLLADNFLKKGESAAFYRQVFVLQLEKTMVRLGIDVPKKFKFLVDKKIREEWNARQQLEADFFEEAEIDQKFSEAFREGLALSERTEVEKQTSLGVEEKLAQKLAEQNVQRKEADLVSWLEKGEAETVGLIQSLLREFPEDPRQFSVF